MPRKFFLDSSLVFYCSGNIGYRWAVKVMQLIAQNNNTLYVDTLCYQEVLDRFDKYNDRDRAEIIYKAFRGLIKNTVPVNVEDFDKAYKLYIKYPRMSPRVLLRIATTLNNDSRYLCSTYSADLESVKEITRINLMEKIQT